ncbi:MAG: Na(+)/H(+) antiporter NhaA [Catillopecten margaritatus gill symbiont]|uniref:Na(+)/H(+) antiporter NhaA n=1 Tax=Catillopecten margaritatus gill symbiont TaxID=3083288 RepID=A0AAU6PFJ1_9GAMM
MKLCAPWEKAFKKISTPFEHFLHAQTTTGLALMLTTVLALVLANSSLSDVYAHTLHTKINLTIGTWSLSHPIHYWINDGLMTFFFFIIGLEIKREVLNGELSNIKVAILPILAAIGGMLFPAFLYLTVNSGGEGAIGWGIPMATDIAFAISVLVLLKKSIPVSLVTFLVALAIVDDLGAVLVIATFYTDQIHLLPLALSGVSFLILIAFNRFGIHAMLPYLAVGLFMWFFMLESGVHATISGVIAAMAIPSKPKRLPESFSKQIKSLLNEYDEHPNQSTHKLNEKQKTVLMKIERNIDEVGTPAARLENDLHLPIALIVIPLFALANAGIAIDLDSIGETIVRPIPVGIMLGLVLGKVIGIFGVAWLAIKSKIATLPKDSTMSQIFGVSLLGGIGFTMSIFVADLAFLGSPDFIFQAKVGVLAASLFSGVAGFIWLKYIAKSEGE